MNNENIKRRKLLKYGLAMGAAPAILGATSANAQMSPNIDLSTPEARFKAHTKIVGSTAKETVYSWFDGGLWGMMPNREPVVLCGFQGLARSDWKPQSDGSSIQHSFDVGIFTDMETGEPLDTMVNPLTGETIEPFHYQYGGWEQHHKVDNELYSAAEASKFAIRDNDVAYREFGTRTVDHPIPMERWPRESAGEKYHAASETNFLSPMVQVFDADVTSADYKLFWTAVLSWEPWLLMDGAPGFVMWRGIGRKLSSYEDAPDNLLKYIRKVQPNYFDPGAPWDGIMSSIEEFKKRRTPADK